ncbi:MAG: hypothetical protein WC718_07270 [Phycisphaerales bacterium]|jgi:hypothetical protein
MSYELGLKCKTYEAGADLSAYQYYPVVENSTSGRVNVTTTKGAVIVGILQNAPSAAGQGALVAVGGISKAVVWTGSTTKAIAYGDSLILGSTRKKLEKSSTGGTAYRFARAEEACSTGVTAGIIAVRITHEGPTSTS